MSSFYGSVTVLEKVKKTVLLPDVESLQQVEDEVKKGNSMEGDTMDREVLGVEQVLNISGDFDMDKEEQSEEGETGEKDGE